MCVISILAVVCGDDVRVAGYDGATTCLKDGGCMRCSAYVNFPAVGSDDLYNGALSSDASPSDVNCGPVTGVHVSTSCIDDGGEIRIEAVPLKVEGVVTVVDEEVGVIEDEGLRSTDVDESMTDEEVDLYSNVTVRSDDGISPTAVECGVGHCLTDGGMIRECCMSFHDGLTPGSSVPDLL